jgi:hypothetical protein
VCDTNRVADCEPGYHGPRCEICDGPEYSKHFHKVDARCHDCGDVNAQATAIGAAVFAVCLAIITGGATVYQGKCCPRAGQAMNHLVRRFHRLWTTAGMRYKVKAMVGLYQCVAAVPSAYDVITPRGLEEYTQWINLLELPADLENMLIPASCFGGYRKRLWLGSSWPLGLVAILVVGCVGWEVARNVRNYNPKEATPRTTLGAVDAGVQRVLPVVLGLSFLLLPSTSTRIFNTFLCDPIEYDNANGEVRRYQHYDLALGCDSGEYTSMYYNALVLVIICPVGVPLLYAALLYLSRDALLTGISTRLSQTTMFLWGDCDAVAPQTKFPFEDRDCMCPHFMRLCACR